MPIIIPDNIPAKQVLVNEKINFIERSKVEDRAKEPIVRILILNLMPLKIPTETQLIRLLASAPYRVEIDLMRIKNHVSKNTSKEHLDKYYITLDEVKQNQYDGFIVTGAPVELLEFEDVTYWEELKEIFNWSDKNVFSTFFICWAAQAALYYWHNIPKYTLDRKMFGVFRHKIYNDKTPIVRGFNDMFMAPHSRYTEISANNIKNVPELELIADSNEAGVYIVASRDMKRVYVTGHSEYDTETLKSEYERDIAKGLDIHLPANYFPLNDSNNLPENSWRSHGYLLYHNWLNHYVYERKYFGKDCSGQCF